MSNNKQSSLDKEFVPYEESLELKELGFDEPCFGFYFINGNKFDFQFAKLPNNHDFKDSPLKEVARPTFSQAFRWFRDNHSYSHSITEHEIIEGQIDFLYIDENEEFQNVEWLARVHPSFIKAFKSYEEAELACLRKLIEIVKKK